MNKMKQIYGKKGKITLLSGFFIIFLVLQTPTNPNSDLFKESGINPTYPANPANQIRKIIFSNYSWEVRTTNEEFQGPGPNLFDDGNESVWVDENGYLHLKIRFINNSWYCAEIYSEEHFGYGTYEFKLSPGYENLDVNVVLGLFTYLDDTHEIDIEFARWGYENNENGQYATQPASKSNNIERFVLPATIGTSTHQFTWCEKYIQFYSEWNENSNQVISTQDNEWTYEGSDNPTPSSERVHMNLWLMSGFAPINNEEAEIIVEEFQFIPSECETINNIPGFNIYLIISGGLLGIVMIIIEIKRKIQ